MASFKLPHVDRSVYRDLDFNRLSALDSFRDELDIHFGKFMHKLHGLYNWISNIANAFGCVQFLFRFTAFYEEIPHTFITAIKIRTIKQDNRWFFLESRWFHFIGSSAFDLIFRKYAFNETLLCWTRFGFMLWNCNLNSFNENFASTKAFCELFDNSILTFSTFFWVKSLKIVRFFPLL